MKQLSLLHQHIAELKAIQLLTGENVVNPPPIPEWVKFVKKHYYHEGRLVRVGQDDPESIYGYAWIPYAIFNEIQYIAMHPEHNTKQQRPMFIEHITHCEISTVKRARQHSRYWFEYSKCI
jgi:hypothetical protein